MNPVLSPTFKLKNPRSCSQLRMLIETPKQKPSVMKIGITFVSFQSWIVLLRITGPLSSDCSKLVYVNQQRKSKFLLCFFLDFVAPASVNNLFWLLFWRFGVRRKVSFSD